MALRVQTESVPTSGPGGKPPPAAVRIAVKAVPGAKRDEIVGVLGDRLKVRVTAPPEGGRANKAICALIAEALGCPVRCVEVISGQGAPEKTVRLLGVNAEQAARLGRGKPA